MKQARILVSALLLVALAGSSVRAAGSDGPAAQPPAAGASAAAAAINVVYMPVRFVITTVGALLGGLTGAFTAGNTPAAAAVADAFEGNNAITPQVIQGQEPFRFGSPPAS